MEKSIEKFALVLIFMFSILASCGQPLRLEVPPVPIETPSPVVAGMEPRTTIIVNWNIKKHNPSNLGAIELVTFVNPSVGWLASSNRLFKTTNSGKTWKAVAFHPMDSSNIAGINFIDNDNGVIVTEISNGRNELDQGIEIQSTSDAGVTWTKRHSIKGASFASIENNGSSMWVTGIKYNRLAPICFSSLLIVSGADLSDWKQIKISNDNGECSNEGAMAGLVLNNGNIRILLSDRSILEKTQASETWKLIQKFEIHDPQSVIVSYGNLETDFPWIAETTDGEEGTHSRLAFIRDDGKIELRENPGIIFTDVVQINGEHFLLCGGRIEDQSEGKLVAKRQRSIAIIWETLDGGETFREVLSDKGLTKFIAIEQNRADRTKFWVVGEGGSLIQLVRSN